MIGYSDTSFSSSLCPPGSPPKAASPLIDQHRLAGGPEKRGAAIQLTPLWEHVVRTQSVPKDVNLEDIFMALNERLRDPEWEVRQHALRVLVDVIPVMDDTLDQKMEILLGDLVGNLGHPGPAVRKGALDSLKVYLAHSSHSDDILHNIIFRGVENFSENQLQSDVVVGIILSLPSLIFPGRTNDSTIEYVIKILISKLVQVTFQEVSLKSLVRIRDIIGTNEFDRILEDMQPNTRRDFELLCQVYEAHEQKPRFNSYDGSFDEDRSKWNDLNANVINDNRWNSDSDSAGVLSQDENSKSKDGEQNESVDAENNMPAGKVILETEIQFNSSTAVTMKILEEGESKSVNDSDSDDDNQDCVVQVLSDSDNEEIFELRRRTPRRVHFGGEIVKLRTPDSDSNHPSDTDNDITITTTTINDSSNPVIEIKFITDSKETKKSHQSRSLIPVPVSPVTQKPKARSLPTSPSRKLETNNKSRLLYQSHPNLMRSHFFSDKQNKSFVDKQNKKNKTEKSLRPKLDIKKSTNYVDNATSPISTHRQIELFHNLTRSPTRPKPNENTLPRPPEQRYLNDTLRKPTTERRITTADSVLLESKQKKMKESRITTADTVRQKPKLSLLDKKESSNTDTSFINDISDNDSHHTRTYSSFILKDSGSEIQSDTTIPNIDTGDCLTCSSSGSEGIYSDNSWEATGIIDKKIIKDIHDKDDLRTKLQGFESLGKELRNAEVLKGLQPYMSSLLHFLFNAEKHPRLQSTAEDILKSILSSISNENLKSCLPQIAMSLSKMGAPAGVKLGIIIMQKITARTLVQHILEDPIISSRSAKTREGALQLLICATTMFPSTEFDTGTTVERVALVATDRKRRVRQATLDLLAVLAQIGQPGVVLEAATLAAKDLPDRDGLLTAIRARISRRQLPIVEPDGTVVYASPGVGHGADVEWVAAGSGSISPCSARSRRRAMTPASTTNTRSESAIVPQRNMWSARRNQDSMESFGNPSSQQDNATWSVVPMANKDEPHNKTYPGTQLWAVDQSSLNGNVRVNGSSGSLRPVFLLQAQQPSATRLRQPSPNEIKNENRDSVDANNPAYSRGRSSSPPVRLVQIKGATRPSRGQSSSPPNFGRRNLPESFARRRAFPSDESSGSSHSRGSPPRTNWRREFQSAIPVPVSGEGGRNRFRRRNREERDSSTQAQPVVALPQHHQEFQRFHNGGGATITSAPIRRVYGQTKSPSPTRFSTDKFSISQDSGINNQHTSSSGSESSDYYTPPAEPYLPLQPSEPIPSNGNHPEDSFDHSDRSDSPTIVQQPQERFINLEDSGSTSDYDEQQKHSEDSPDETDFVRTQIYQKLQEEHITSVVIREPPFREKVVDERLSKSHADLSEVKKLSRKTINSAPLAKQIKGLENSLIAERKQSLSNQNAVEEESKSSQNSSVADLKSLNHSQTDLRSANQSQTELRSLESQENISLSPAIRSQEDLRSPNQSQTDLKSFDQSQKDLRGLSESRTDLQSMNGNQLDLRSKDSSNKSSPLKYPEIVRKKSVSKLKVDVKRRPSISAKTPTLFPDTLRSFPKPREGFSEVVAQLESPEWEQSIKGLQGLVRLVRHHPDTIEQHMHQTCVLLGRHIKNLRSQVARAACLAATEMFVTHKKNLEPELEELAVPLLQRTADTNKFLRADANSALDAMCVNVGACRSVTILSTRGATHHNAVVRSATARLFADLVHRIGPGRVFQLPREIRDRILSVGANMLMEGSLETRKHAKNMFTELSTHPTFHRALTEAVAASTMRHISKILHSLK